MVRKWKTIRVFISSTFRDTHFERDALTRLVFPELRQWCEERYLHITEVDLRWGVTQEESANGKAIEICLDEIDRSEFFLCLIGSRYGWIPDEYEVGQEDRFKWVLEQEGLSITELEIMRGCLNPESECASNVSHAMFYFRDETFLEELKSKPKELIQFTDGAVEYQAGSLVYVTDEEKKEKLKNLKERIRSHKPGDQNNIDVTIHEDYESLYHVDESLSGMNENVLRKFCSMVLEDLKAAIDARYPLSKMVHETEIDPLKMEQNYHTSFMEYCLSSFEDRSDIVTKIVRYAESEVALGPLVCSSEPGMGKSSVVAKACSIIESKIAPPASQPSSRVLDKLNSAKKKKPLVLLRYFAGASPGSLHIHNMLRTLLQDLRRNLKKYKPKKRAAQLWSLLKASISLGNATSHSKSSSVKHGTLRVGDNKSTVTGKSTKRHFISAEIPSNFQDLTEDFKRALIECCEYCRVVLVIDNLDHITNDKNNAMTLRWLPQELPLGLRLIVGLDEHVQTISPQARKIKNNKTGKEKSFRRPLSPCSDSGVDYNRSGGAYSQTVGHLNLNRHALTYSNVIGNKYDARNFLESFQLHFKHITQVCVPGLSKKLSQQLVRNRLGGYGKKLSSKQMDILLHKRSSDNPTWLVICVEELRVFAEYEKVEQRILELADDLPSLLEQMIKRLERDHGPRFVRDTLSMLVCSRDGLYEREIVGVLGVPMSSWSQLFYSIKPVLRAGSRGNDDQLISFQHRNFVLAVLKRYFLSKPTAPLSPGSPLLARSIDGSSLRGPLSTSGPQIDAADIESMQQSSAYAIPIHARLAIYFKEESRDRGSWNPEKRRALSSLAYHLLYGKLYRTLENTLTDLEFVEALMTSGSGFSWVDDLSNCLSAFEKEQAIQEQTQLQIASNKNTPGLGLDYNFLSPPSSPVPAASSTSGVGRDNTPDEAALGSPSAQNKQLLEVTVTKDMIARIRDYYVFAQQFIPELNNCPSLVFQYASNLPDSSSACVAADKLWQRYLFEGSNPDAVAPRANGKRVLTIRPWLKWINKPQVSGPCLMTLSGHSGTILHCDISRDEKKVVTASVDRNIRVWIVQTGESSLVLEGHTDAVTGVQFSPLNNDVVVSCSRDGTARVWVKGVCARIFDKHGTSPVLCCTISECGNYVATGDQAGKLLIWDIFSEAECIHDFKHFFGAIKMVRFAATNDYIFAAGADRTIRGWSLVDGSQYMTKSGEALCFSSEWASDDEKLFYCVRTSAMKLKVFDAKVVNKSLSQPCSISQPYNDEEDHSIYDDISEDDAHRFLDFAEGDFDLTEEKDGQKEVKLPTKKELKMDEPVVKRQGIANVTLKDSNSHLVKVCGLSPNNRLAAGRMDGNIAIFNTMSGQMMCQLYGHIGNINHVAYSVSGNRLVSACDDHTAKVWNPRRAKLGGNTPHKNRVIRCTFSQSSKCLSLLSISQEGQVSLWNASTGYRTSINPEKHNVHDASFTPSGSHYVTVDNSVKIFQSMGSKGGTSSRRSWVIPETNVGLWSLSPCSKIFVTVERGSSEVHVWNIYCNPVRLVRVMKRAHDKKITVCQFSKDGGLLYTAANDGQIKLWDVLKLTTEMLLPHADNNNHNSNNANVGGEENNIFPLLTLYDQKDLGLASLLHAVHESADGKCLLVVSDSIDLKLWDLEAALEHQSHHEVTSLHGHTTRVTCAAWAPHGYSFVSGSVNGTLRLWKRVSLESTLFRGHTSSVVDIQYLPDGRRIASISTDKSLAIWSTLTGEQINSMLFGASLSALSISSTGEYLAVGDTKGDMRILCVMNPHFGKECSDDKSQEARFEDQEFPFVCPRKIMHITVKGPKKWDNRCLIDCPHCSRSFSASGNSLDLIKKTEYHVSVSGFSEDVLRDMKLLIRCVHCRRLLRLCPFTLDRQRLLGRLLWSERMTKKKLRPMTKDVTEAAALIQEASRNAASFYDPNTNAKMTPFHSKSPTHKRLPKLSTSSKIANSGAENHDLMTKHLHALSLKSKNVKYATFKGQGHNKRGGKDDDKFLKAVTESNNNKKKMLTKVKSAQCLATPSIHGIRTPNWLEAFAKTETEAQTKFRAVAERRQIGNGVNRSLSFVESERFQLDAPAMMHTSSCLDDHFLEVEGPLIRRCNTASSGNRIKVLKCTADLRYPENLYQLAHGRPATSQLENLRRANPVSLRIAPDVIDFGILCEDGTYRFPVTLTNTNSSLVRFRCAVEHASQTESWHERDSEAPNPCTRMSVIQPPNSNPLVHGLSVTIYLEILTTKPSEVDGILRISTNVGHLLSTPIRASVASKADYASSIKRNSAIHDGEITNKQVIVISNALNTKTDL